MDFPSRISLYFLPPLDSPFLVSHYIPCISFGSPIPHPAVSSIDLHEFPIDILISLPSRISLFLPESPRTSSDLSIFPMDRSISLLHASFQIFFYLLWVSRIFHLPPYTSSGSAPIQELPISASSSPSRTFVGFSVPPRVSHGSLCIHPEPPIPDLSVYLLGILSWIALYFLDSPPRISACFLWISHLRSP
jgi:hypothetical protein